MDDVGQAHRPRPTVAAASAINTAPFNALIRLRDGFSKSGRKLLQRILPLVEQGDQKTPGHDANMLHDLAMALLSGRGEASGVAIATDLLDLYEASDTRVRGEFFDMLAARFDPDAQTLAECWERYRAEGGRALPALCRAVEAPRQELFRRLNLAPGGTAALVRLRADLLSAMDGEAALGKVDYDLSHLLQSWFNRGFLTMKSIDWSSPASLLERLIRYEAVHDISSWSDLRRRLEPEDRRCFAFFHPAMPDEPLIFVEVGLTTEMPDNIQEMLAPDRVPISASAATTATFYSISNCQPGLRGISFGHFLIKQVAADLKRELPNLKSFVTLSPIPGLMSWLRGASTASDDRTLINALSAPEDLTNINEAPARKLLERQATLYFMEVRNAAGKPKDPVARFHLGNGARLERLNWRGDNSPKGLKQSGGLMVNYLYDLDRIEENHEAFAERGEIIVGAPFRRLMASTAAKA